MLHQADFPGIAGGRLFASQFNACLRVNKEAQASDSAVEEADEQPPAEDNQEPASDHDSSKPNLRQKRFCPLDLQSLVIPVFWLFGGQSTKNWFEIKHWLSSSPRTGAVDKG